MNKTLERIEIWRLLHHFKRKGGKVGQKTVTRRFWRCIYPTDLDPQPKDVPLGSKLDWAFSADYEKARKAAKLKVGTGDCVVVFRYQKIDPTTKKKVQTTKTCHVPRKELGHTGTIYRRTFKPPSSQLYWTRIADRQMLRWSDQTATHPVAKQKQAEDRDLVIRPLYLRHVQGDEDDLIYTAHSPRTRAEATQLFRRQQQFEYKYLDPGGMCDALAENTVWQVETKGDPQGPKPTRQEIAEFQEQREKRYGAFRRIEQLLADPNWATSEANRFKFLECADTIFDPAVPSATAGSTIFTSATTFVTGIVDYDWNAGEGAGALTGQVGGAIGTGQSVFEGIAVGWMAARGVYELSKMLRDNANGEKIDWAAFRTKSADLSVTLGRGVPVVVSSVESLGKIIIAAGENGATLAQKFADAASPFSAAAGFFGAAVSLASAGRSFRKADKSFTRRDKAAKIFQAIGADGGVVVDRPSEITDLPLLRSYMEAKLSRRGNRMVATGVTGLISTAAGVCGGVGGLVAAGTLAGGVAVANIWNPVGWALGAVALAGGIAITGYVIYRWWKRDERHKKRHRENKIATPEEFADRLLDFCRQHDDPNQPLYSDARSLLHAFGVPIRDVGMMPQPRLIPKIDHDDARDRIAKHFK